MSERRKSFFTKDANPDKSILQYLNNIQSLKRNSVHKIESGINKTSSQQTTADTNKRNTVQLTSQDIDIISEKINKSIFMQSEVDLNQLITTVSINNPRKSIKPSYNNSPDLHSKLVLVSPERNNSKRTTTKKVTGSILPIMPILPRKKYKNSQDLFSQTLNFQLKHRSDITNQLLLNTQIRILKKKQVKKKNADHIPMFNNTVNLNKYIISQYHIGDGKSNLYSKKKQKITEETFSVIRQKKINEIKKQNKTALMMTLENTNHNYAIESDDTSFKNYQENDLKDIKEQYYRNKESERLTMADDFLKKLKDLSNSEYQQMDKNTLINYKNLSRIMRVMKIKTKSNSNSIVNQKIKLQEDEEKVILATSKLGPPLYAKTKLKTETNSKFIGIKGSYFGYPV